MTVKQPSAILNPAPTAIPNTAGGEGRTIAHQAFSQFAPTKFYEVEQRLANISTHPDLPAQPLWGFDGLVPGPLYVERYGRPVLVRNHNNLPANNGGFGKNFVTTHLHNGHTPAESDGNPCDYFTPGQFYDQHYPNVLAGVNSTHQPTGGDIQESMSTLWYHESNNIRWTSWSCLPLRGHGRVKRSGGSMGAEASQDTARDSQNEASRTSC
jgi:hypothetical protein